MEQFRIEVASGGSGLFFDIKPLGEDRYEIFDQGEPVGVITLDQNDHASCKAEGCELDLPVLHSIREVIQIHERWTPRPGQH